MKYIEMKSEGYTHRYDFNSHIYLRKMHIIKHLLDAILPDFIIAVMTEESDRNDNISSLEIQLFLDSHKLILKVCASTESDDFIATLHIIQLLNQAHLNHCKSNNDNCGCICLAFWHPYRKENQAL